MNGRLMNGPNADLRAIFSEALDQNTPEDLAKFLDAACQADADLRTQVEALLAAHRDAGKFLGGTPSDSGSAPTIDPPIPEGPGTVIGPYKLLEQIGEGGFGVVFMAEQQQPIRRKIALKVLKPGMDIRQVVARFEVERQTLALMDHPNIATILDAGTTEPIADGKSEISNLKSAISSGRPYFVMELVRGVPITEFCDQNHLAVRARLELFVSVCQAVQHAHQKGIIHRDLKPSNVMVTLHDDKPVVKVIDFGIAKATGEQLTEKTLLTNFAQMIGTPLYMSPEQAQMTGLDVDTRSDIYSLGVLLYELLTGTTPFDKERLRTVGYDEIRRIIREEEPARPSTRISTLGQAATAASANRQSDPKRLSHLFRGELDWIVMKALEKDRNRRYETASAFAADVQRYLHDEPVLACPPSPWYRFRKFARRHRGPLVTGAVLAAGLVLTAVALAVSNVLVTRERDEKAQALRDKEQALKQETAARAEAKAQEELANNNAAEAKKQKKISEEQELLARRRFYAAQMNLANHAWEGGNPARVLELLESQWPSSDRQDLRTFEWYYLWRLCHQNHRLTLRGQQRVYSVAFSADGKLLASGGNQGDIKLWNFTTGKESVTLRGAPGAWRVAFSPDGRLLAVASGLMGGYGVNLWDVATGKPQATLDHAGELVRSLAFSPDGKTLATGTDRKTVRLWDVATRQKQTAFEAQAPAVYCLQFSPDGKKLATASPWYDPCTTCWNLATQPPQITVRLPGAYGLAFSPDGKTLATGSGGGTVTLWDVATGKERARRETGWGKIFDVAFSPDGATLACATERRFVVLWEPATGQTRLLPHENIVYSVAFAPDGKTLASGSWDGTIRLWHLNPRQKTISLQHTANVLTTAISPDSSALAVLTVDGTVTMWELSTGKMRATLRGQAGSHGSVVFSPDGKILASASAFWEQLKPSEVKLWDVTTGRELGTLPGPAFFVAFSPDGKTLASAAADGSLSLWDMATRERRLTIKAAGGGLVLAFSPDSKRLATGAYFGVVKLWDVRTGQDQATIQEGQGANYPFRSLGFSPDGSILATGGWDGTVKLWDPATKQLRGSLRGHTALIWSMAFFPDSKTLVTASEDGTVKL